jgi:hypothetical protein
MKNLFLFLAFICIGFLIWTENIQKKRLNIMSDSIERLIMIEIITEKQFSNLQKKVEKLENFNRIADNN